MGPGVTLLLGLLCLVSFYESIDIYYGTYHAKGQVSSFKIVDLAAVWNSDPAARKLSANILNVRISVDFELSKSFSIDISLKSNTTGPCLLGKIKHIQIFRLGGGG